MNQVFLSLGSNQKHPLRQLRRAINALKALPHTYILKCSSFYWTKAWGVQAQQDFCNSVIEINTLLPPRILLKHCQEIEKKQGRVRKKRWGPRTLDIDILMYEKQALKSKILTIPHPQMHKRDFVLVPLSEIFPPTVGQAEA